MDIDSNCPYLLFQLFFLMLEIAWNAKKTWNIEKKKKYII